MLTYAKLSPSMKALISKPKNEKALKGYSMKILETTEHSRGICWTGIIELNDKPIVKVENTGNGGAKDYDYVDKDSYEKLVKLAEQAYPDSYEPLDILVSYLDVISNL